MGGPGLCDRRLIIDIRDFQLMITDLYATEEWLKGQLELFYFTDIEKL